MLDRLQAARRRRRRHRSAVRLHGRPRPTGPSPQLRLEPQQGRSDPFTIQDLTSDPFIYLSGPRRGVYLQCRVLIEYDIRMKQSGDTMQDDDLPLIDGAATFIDGAITNGTSLDGTDTSREASSSSSSQRSGPVVSLLGYRTKSRSSIRGDIGDLCELKRFVVAVRLNSPLFLYFKAPALGADPICKFAFRAVSHELDSSSTIEVKVTCQICTSSRLM